MFDAKIYSKARLSRDPRFDGKFFTAVKTTKIYCRSICPAVPPKEENVVYYSRAIEAAHAGYRPCLRCRPDSAPGSPGWKGVNTTLERAIKLISQGTLHEGSIEVLAERLGISDRYLRQLFKKYLGISPKSYALYQQCLFAKQLLHQTTLPITQVALASGFNSIRRFNDCFLSQLNLTPSAIRKSQEKKSNSLQLQLCYRPPYDWESMHNFLATRAISELEWCDKSSYGRTFTWHGCKGHFTAQHLAQKNSFSVSIELDDMTHLKSVVNNIRRILDLDVDIQAVETDLSGYFSTHMQLKSGLRLPGIWNVFEAGIRAILGQQISVVAARKLLLQLVEELGLEHQKRKLFPTPESIAQSNLNFLKIPASRKQTLHDFAQHYIDHDAPDIPQHWEKIKGIGPWTIHYALLRGLSDPDVCLATDLVIKKIISQLNDDFDINVASPWCSYLTLQLWHQAAIDNA